MTDLLIKRGTCSSCALKVREASTNAQGIEEVRLYCRRDPPQTLPIKAFVPIAALGQQAGLNLPPGSLVEQVIMTQSNFPFVRPDWWCESYSVISRVPGQGIGVPGEDLAKGEGEA